DPGLRPLHSGGEAGRRKQDAHRISALDQRTEKDTMSNKLEGKTAVITGGTSGMGLATAKRFVAEGAYVFIMGRRQHELDAAVKEIGTHVTGVQGDIAKLPDLDRLYDIVKAQKGRVDIVFANAGVGEFVATDAMTEAHFAM